MKKLILLIFIPLVSFGQTAKKYDSDKVTFFYSDIYIPTDERVSVKNIDVKLVLKDWKISRNNNNVVIDVIDIYTSKFEQENLILERFNNLQGVENLSIKRVQINGNEIMVLKLVYKGRFLKSYNFIKNRKLCTITLSSASAVLLNELVEDSEIIFNTIKIKI